eukprot:3275516-Rhodomonas_salina.2
MPGFLRLRSRFFSRFQGRVGLSICRAAGSQGMMSGPTYSIRTRRGVLRTSDLGYGEDLPAGHQCRAEAVPNAEGSPTPSLSTPSINTSASSSGGGSRHGILDSEAIENSCILVAVCACLQQYGSLQVRGPCGICALPVTTMQGCDETQTGESSVTSITRTRTANAFCRTTSSDR